MSKRNKTFSRELPGMMYGYGDAEKPYRESVKVVDDLVRQYIEALCQQALGIALLRGDALSVECFAAAVQSQPKKSRRVTKLLEMRSRIAEARKIADYDAYAQQS